jgi:hypothetical protein
MDVDKILDWGAAFMVGYVLGLGIALVSLVFARGY